MRGRSKSRDEANALLIAELVRRLDWPILDKAQFDRLGEMEEAVCDYCICIVLRP